MTRTSSNCANRAATILVTSVFLSFLASPSLGQSAKSTLEDPVQATRFNDISDRLVCQCGCTMVLRVCNHFECPSAIPMRAQIEKQIVAGMTDDAIVEAFVAEHGKVVLATPPPEGLNLAAWVMPGFAILIGAFFLAYFLTGWIAKKKIHSVSTTPELDPELAERIEKELQGMDR